MRAGAAGIIACTFEHCQVHLIVTAEVGNGTAGAHFSRILHGLEQVDSSLEESVADLRERLIRQAGVALGDARGAQFAVARSLPRHHRKLQPNVILQTIASGPPFFGAETPPVESVELDLNRLDFAGNDVLIDSRRSHAVNVARVDHVRSLSPRHVLMGAGFGICALHVEEHLATVSIVMKT